MIFIAVSMIESTLLVKAGTKENVPKPSNIPPTRNNKNRKALVCCCCCYIFMLHASFKVVYPNYKSIKLLLAYEIIFWSAPIDSIVLNFVEMN